MNRERTYILNGPWHLAACLFFAGFSLATGQTTYVTDFGEGSLGLDGWKSDDTRDSLGINLIGSSYTHAAVGPAVAGDDSLIASQLDWASDFFGSRGNLGGLRFDAGVDAPGKSTISVIDPTSPGGLGLATLLGDAGFGASYRWLKEDNQAAAGVSLKIGIQSSLWGTDAGNSQAGFTPLRSGETVWDLVLVYDPTNNYPGTTTSFQQGQFYTQTITANTGRWFLYDQAGNSFFDTTIGPVPGNSNPANSGKTLAEWLADPTWGAVISGGKITDTQFGIGSGNANTRVTLDYAKISYVNSGGLMDFVDAVRWTGGGSGNLGEAANWSDNESLGSSKNLLFDPGSDSSTTLTAAPGSTSNIRSLAAGNGTVTISLGAGASLIANNDGFLSAENGATLHLSGGSVTAAAVEAWGSVEIADSTVMLDGGSVNQPGRGGRYGIVVGAGGNLTLQGGANVTVANGSAGVVVRVGEGAGGAAQLNVESGATLTIGTSTSLGALQVGDFGTTAEVVQTGGLVEVVGSMNIGNRSSAAAGSQGTYTLSGGTLRLSGGLYSLGRTVGADPFAATGQFNLSGGLLDVIDGGFVIGDRDSTGLQGSGTLTQTGGILRLGPTAGLFIAGFGGGTYNLDGGTLEAGGNSLRANYNNSASYAFNLGNATIKVVGSDLTTDAGLTVKPGASATIDTNSFNAIFQGPLVGDGSLTKTGHGAATVEAASILKSLILEQGSIVAHAAIEASGEVNLAPGTTFTASGAGSLKLTSSAILKGTGLLDSPALVQGTVAPGNSAGRLTIGADFTLATGARYLWELTDDSIAQPGVDFDQLLVTGGMLTIEPGASLELAFGAGVDFGDPFWGSPQSWTVIDGYDSSALSYGGFSLVNASNPAGEFSVGQFGDDVMLTWQPAPEPSAGLLAASAIGLLGMRRGRRATR